MNKRWWRFVGAVGLLAGLPVPALAQTAQTIEGAKTFLEKVLPGSRYAAESASAIGTVMLPQDLDLNGSFEDWIGLLGEPIGTDSTCWLMFNYSRPGFVYRDRSVAATPFADINMDFRNITEIVSSEKQVILTNPNWKGVRTKVFASSPEMAGRIAVAMNFLKTRCNVADLTGF
ncbi:MAG: hypothetical protein V4808_00975 [Pseudomonadota bacterium]